MEIKNKKKSLISLLLAAILFMTLLPAMSIIALADATHVDPVLDATVSVSAGNDSQYFMYPFEVGKAYRVTATWESAPSFTGSAAGWKLQTAAEQGNNSVGDLLIKAAKKSDTANDSSVQIYSGIVVPTQDFSLLHLDTTGLAVINSITITVEPAVMEERLLMDATISIATGTKYINGYFDVAFEKGRSYTILAEWESIPTYTAGSTAWKVQGATNTSVDGDDAVIYRATREVLTNTAIQSYIGEFIPAANKPIFNFFTQYVSDANQIHLKIVENSEGLSSEIAVPVGSSNKYVSYPFKAGMAYNITATWASTPSFTGSAVGWTLQASDTQLGETVSELLLRTAKKCDTTSDSLVQVYSGVFAPTQDFSELHLNTQGLAEANIITITASPVTLEEGVLLDATISIAAGTKYLNGYFDVDFKKGKSYTILAEWIDVPTYTAGSTAWKIQGAANTSIDGDDAVIYRATRDVSTNTAIQSYIGGFIPAANKPIFNFFTQHVNGANQIHFKIVEDSFVSQKVSVKKLLSASISGKIMQGFDIFNGIVFQTYDGGSAATYHLSTGTKIAEFPLGSSYTSNHCGNANFGLEYPDGNTEFPALYVSGDLTTKACYVENVTTTTSQLIQTIYFDIDPSYTGGQIIIDRDRERILYMQRKNSNIRDLTNVFMIAEFPIPALSEGSEVRYTNADIIGESYELSYYSPLYQGACIYGGKLLQSHGLLANSFGSKVGLMTFDVLTHKLESHIDLSALIPYEPQGVTVYESRIIMNFNNGGLYEITLVE